LLVWGDNLLLLMFDLQPEYCFDSLSVD
jgi:hypothetical protein